MVINAGQSLFDPYSSLSNTKFTDISLISILVVSQNIFSNNVNTALVMGISIPLAVLRT